MENFGHIVCTRFGINVYDDEWFTHRFLLFEAFTLPSLTSQSCKDFVWCIFIGKDMPEKHLSKLKKITKPFSNIMLIPVDVTWKTQDLSKVFNKVFHEKEFILSSRIDDDDLWEENYVKSIHDKINTTPNCECLITHPLGYEFVIDEVYSDGRFYEKQLTKYWYPCLGTSINVYSHRNRMLTCLDSAHSKMEDFSKSNGLAYCEIFQTKPMWIYLRHKQADSSIKKSNDHEKINISYISKNFGINWDKYQNYLHESHKFRNGEKRIVDSRARMKRDIISSGGNAATELKSTLIEHENLRLLNKNIIDFYNKWVSSNTDIMLYLNKDREASVNVSTNDKKEYLITSDKVGKALPKNSEQFSLDEFPRKIKIECFVETYGSVSTSLHINQFNDSKILTSSSTQLNEGKQFFNIDFLPESKFYKLVLSFLGEGIVTIKNISTYERLDCDQ